MSIDVGEAATRKIGPLPAWAWGAVVGGGYLVYRVASGGGSGGASSPFVQPIAGGDAFDYEGAAGGGGGGASSGSGTGTGTATVAKWGSDVPDYIRRLFDADEIAARLGYYGTTIDLNDLRRLNLNLTGTGPISGTPTTPTAAVPWGSSVPTATRSQYDLAAIVKYLDAQKIDYGTTIDAGDLQRYLDAQKATGDTTANQPPTLGLSFGRASAVARTNAMQAATYMQPVPFMPTRAIAVPGTYAPSLPPVLAAQGDDSGRVSIRSLDPVGGVRRARRRLWAAWREGIVTLPPTVRPPTHIPNPARDIAQRVHPTPTG